MDDARLKCGEFFVDASLYVLSDSFVEAAQELFGASGSEEPECDGAILEI